MDYIASPWRYNYITTADKVPGCVFCERLKESDEQAGIVYRGRHCFVILNAFPYTSGHVMVVPYEHLDQLQKLSPEGATEMILLTRTVESLLRKIYRPDGVNVGMNIGKAAGAGVAGHIHMHVLPRWVGDTNFMTVVGETRVLPEELDQTFRRLRQAWEEQTK